jgi:hypothetical protein
MPKDDSDLDWPNAQATHTVELGLKSVGVAINFVCITLEIADLSFDVPRRDVII